VPITNQETKHASQVLGSNLGRIATNVTEGHRRFLQPLHENSGIGYDHLLHHLTYYHPVIRCYIFLVSDKDVKYTGKYNNK
jgi:hypothetical protein